MRGAPLTLIAGLAALTLTSCAVNEIGVESSSDLSGILIGGGASSQQAAQEAWVAGFQAENSNASVEYDPAGSGAGRDTFAAGGSAFAGSDRAFHADEIADGGFGACTEGSNIIEVPAYISPIAIVFQVEGVDELNLDPSTIARIFSGDIRSWDDPAIVEQNPDVSLPDLAITAVHRSDESGTTETFTEYLHAAAPAEWEWEPDGSWPFEGGEAAQGTSGVVDTVTRGRGSIGYADASRAGDLGLVKVKVGAEYVPYSAEAAAAIVDVSPVEEGRTAGDLAIEIDRASTAAGVYPIALVSYLIGCESYEDSGQAELARAYFEYVISDEGQQAAAEHAGSAPLSDSLQERAQAAVALIS